MIRALYTAASGMNAQQSNIDNVAHNLANVNTTGFKKSRVEFEDLVYQELRAPGAQASATTETPVGLEMGLGTRAVATARNFSAGNLRTTAAPLDIAIEGAGFFKIALPSGTTAYARGDLSPQCPRHDRERRRVPPRAPGHDSDRRGLDLDLEGWHRLGNGTWPGQQPGRRDRDRDVRQPGRPAPARGQSLRADDRIGRRRRRRARHRRARHTRAGLRRRLERQRR